MTTSLTSFKKNAQLTLGVELELQLIDLHDFNLSMESSDLLRRLSQVSHPGEIKPEITQAMIELNSSVHSNYSALKAELEVLKNIMVEQARQCHIGISGGGTHPFQKWNAQRISQIERFSTLSEQYGYLAKQFTVFGQHIHIACPHGDDALYLCHAFAQYLPHFVALSAASPFNQGVDTSYDCSRLIAVSAFPLSGTPPWLLTWEQFEEYFEKMSKLGVVKTVKDFYWDIRPKPEYGTVELRICDTPLTVTKAAQLAAYAQTLAHYLLTKRPIISQDIYLTYSVNRFRASRYGLKAEIVNPIQHTHINLAEDILNTCRELKYNAILLDTEDAIQEIQHLAQQQLNDATWLRAQYNELQSLNDVVRTQIRLWDEPIESELAALV